MSLANIFGKPGTGIHKLHFLGVAVWDTVFTVILAIILSVAFGIPITLTVVGLLILAIFLHWLFGVKTSVIKYMHL